LLLIDDEPTIAEPLARFLRAEGFDVEVAGDGATGDSLFVKAELAAAPIDLVLLDWSLPDRPGIELLRAWRARGVVTPVVMLTARHELIDKVLGLELGADDYVTKPFEPRELLARVRARLRQPPSLGSAKPGASTPVLKCAGIEMDEVSRRVTFHGAEVGLTRMEYGLLKVLMENADKVFTRDELLDRVWGYESYPTTRTVDTHVLQLRQKFAAELFETVRGVGYRLTTPADPTKS
jgi:DNA-binding response OmpR family regulator